MMISWSHPSGRWFTIVGIFLASVLGPMGFIHYKYNYSIGPSVEIQEYDGRDVNDEGIPLGTT
jgi:hypothetical protein